MNSASLSTVGQRLKHFRGAKGLTQKEFAEGVSTTQANLSQIENDKVLPTGHFIQDLIASFPEIDLNWLFYGEGQMQRTSAVQGDLQILVERLSQEKKALMDTLELYIRQSSPPER